MASAQEHGEISFQFESANGFGQKIPLKADSSRIGHVAPVSATDRRQMLPILFRHGGVVLDESGIVRVLFKANAADVIESEESKLMLDVTLINKATGTLQSTTLTFDNMTGFTSAGTVDLTHVADQTIEVARYTVPAGTQLVLGNPVDGRAYCYLGDDTA